MEIICEIIATVIQVFLVIWFISEYCGYKYDGTIKVIGFCATLAADCILITIIDSYMAYDGILSLTSVLIYILYCRIFLKRDLFIHIFVSFFAVLIIFTISGIIFSVMSNITEVSILELYDKFMNWRIITLIICRIFEFSVFKFILHIDKAYNLSKKEWMLFLLIMLFSWLEIILFNKATIKYPETKTYILAALLMTAAVNILMYYFVLRINKESKIKTDLTLLKMQYENTKTTEQNLRDLYESGYLMKHDLEKHLIAIKTRAELNNDSDVIDYIDSILNKYNSYIHKTIFTDNEIFNAIINIRLEICKHKGIYTNFNIEHDALANINDEDIVILFGNMLDNAIEAAEETSDKVIILNVQKQGAYISIYMENSFDGNFDPLLQTRKKEKNGHGIGMKNIRAVVDEYNGMIKCFSERGMFCCDVLLENNQI